MPPPQHGHTKSSVVGFNFITEDLHVFVNGHEAMLLRDPNTNAVQIEERLINNRTAQAIAFRVPVSETGPVLVTTSRGMSDTNAILIDLALAELSALAASRPSEATGLVQAQTIVRRHAGIPTGDS